MSRGAQKLGHKRWSICAKKQRYPSASVAQKAANVAMRYRPHQPLRVYDCAECDGWHITKQILKPPKGQS